MFDILVTFITVIYVIICILMILIILLQAGRGGMGTALGGGASQSVFGGGGSSDVLAKITQGCAAGFMIFAMFLAYASAHSGSTNLKAKSDKNAAVELAANAEDEVNYERIGASSLPLPERRDPTAATPNASTHPSTLVPTDPAVPGDAAATAAPTDTAAPADAPPADVAAPADTPTSVAGTDTAAPAEGVAVPTPTQPPVDKPAKAKKPADGEAKKPRKPAAPVNRDADDAPAPEAAPAP